SAAHHLATLTALRRGVGLPQVLRVGDDDGAVGELDLETRPAVHDRSGRDHDATAAVLIEDLIAGLYLAHGGPATGPRDGRIERERLPRAGRARDEHVRHLGQVGHDGPALDVL